MPDDDLASMAGFETQDSVDHVSEEGTETLHASVDKPAQSDLLGHLHAELGILNTKIDYFVSESISDELPQVEAQVQKNLHDQLPTILLKPMYKEFNAFNKLESQRFVLLQKELSKSLYNKIRKSIRLKDLQIMFKDMVSLLEAAKVFKKANAEGEKWEKNNPESPAEENDAQHPDQTKGEQDSGATIVAISSEEDTKKETNDEPPAKKLKFLIPSPTPLKYIMPEPPKVTEAIKMTLDQFTQNLSKTTSSIFSPTPPREPTPPRDESKGKGIATEEPLKDIMPFKEEGGSVLKISSLKSFVTLEGPLSQEKIMAQQKEMKRLTDLKAEKEKSEKFLKKILKPATIRAQTQKMAEHEAKRQKMLNEFNHQRADQLPITKISYVVNSKKESTMKITRGDNPLNLIVHPNFRLKMLGFSEWLEVHALASQKSGKSNDMLLQSLRAKFQ
ncbi:hypothetical protein Tco_1025753 [Tanacetum coccineum]